MSARSFSMIDSSASAWRLVAEIAIKHGDGAALFWLWLQHNHYSHPSGVYQFHPFMAVEPMGLSESEIETLLEDFASERIIRWDSGSHLIYIPSVQSVQGRGIEKLKNNQRVGWRLHLSALPSHEFVDEVWNIACLSPHAKVSKDECSKGPHKTGLREGLTKGLTEGLHDEVETAPIPFGGAA